MKIYNNVAELVGATPLVRFSAYAKSVKEAGSFISPIMILSMLLATSLIRCMLM